MGCGETAEQDVRAYIAEHITFHRIEEDGIPVDLLKLGDSGNEEDTIRKIESIVESHNPNMGSKQQAAVHAAISDMIQKGNVDMASLYEVLTSEQIPYDLADQLADTLSFFVNFKANDRDWGELIEESKNIIIISTKAVRSNGGSGLIDMLLMSLYYYQQAHGEKQLSVFIDEIRTQNLSTKGPIAKILTESRKNRMSLNFATQFLPKSTQVRERCFGWLSRRFSEWLQNMPKVFWLSNIARSTKTDMFSEDRFTILKTEWERTGDGWLKSLHFSEPVSAFSVSVLLRR